MQLLDILHPDECCNKRLSKALANGKVEGISWTCPKCSVEWRAKILAAEDGTPYRKWTPHTPVAVFRV